MNAPDRSVTWAEANKALLVAGQCRKGFGAGEVLRPMELIVGDRATFEVAGQNLPVADTVRASVDSWVGRHLPHVRAGEDLRTRVALAPGSEELRSIFAAGMVLALIGIVRRFATSCPLDTEDMRKPISQVLGGDDPGLREALGWVGAFAYVYHCFASQHGPARDFAVEEPPANS